MVAFCYQAGKSSTRGFLRSGKRRKGHSSGGSSDFTSKASEWPTFLHLDNFDEEWSDLGPGDDDLQELQSAIREAGVSFFF